MNETLRTVRLANDLWSKQGQTIINECEFTARHAFYTPSEGGLPIIICARDEERDLPATLASLTKSRQELFPIVVDNGSSDDTSTVAKRMGAYVLNYEQPGKHGALKHGLRFIEAEYPHVGTVLSTDADTITGRHWAGTLKSELLENSESNPDQLVFGPIMFSHGQSKPTDLLRTITLNAAQVRHSIKDEPPGARGGNLGLTFTHANLESTYSIPDNIGAADDLVLRDTVVFNGGKAKATYRLLSLVVSRGDRFDNLKDFIKVMVGKVDFKEFYRDY